MKEERENSAPFGLDPRTCLACAGVFSLVVACLNNLNAALAALLISLCVLLLDRKKRNNTLRRLFAANAFILFLWLITPFTTPGETVWRWGIFNITKEGITLTALATIKANSLVLIFLALIVPLPISSLGTALHKLRCPDKLTWLFVLMDRNINILRQEWLKLREAARLRCFKPGNNMHTYRAIGSLLGIFLLRAINRSHILHEALLLRGYDGRLPFCDKLIFTFRDYIFWLGTTGVVLLIILMDIGFFRAPV